MATDSSHLECPYCGERIEIGAIISLITSVADGEASVIARREHE